MLTNSQVCEEDRKATVPAGGAHVREGQDCPPVGQRRKGDRYASGR